MSLRDLFSRKNETHRRRKNGLASSALAARVEFLEDRVLLSVESPLLVDHGVNFTNANVLGRTAVTFFPVDNPLYSGNNGNGLNIVLDGAAPDGALVSQLRSITYANLVFNANANCGSVLNISNMTLDEIIIDSSVFTNNGRSGFIIRLNNAQVGRIVVTNSNFTNNAFEGISILATDSRVDSLVMANNAIGNSQANDGGLLRFTDSRLGVVDINNNQFGNNTASGFHIDLNNTNAASMNLVRNTSSNNRLHGMFLDFQDSDVRGSVRGNTLTNSLTGDGLSILMRRSILPNGQVAGGLRNLDLDITSDNLEFPTPDIRKNDFSNNGRSGINIDLGQNTTFGGAITNNLINNNLRVGVNVQAKDTLDAFDVQIGGETVDDQNNNLDANMIDGNGGAGIVISLDDTSNVAGNTSGRFRILNNVISNTVNDNQISTEFAGEGIFVRARGLAALVNGAARILNSRIDGNTITGNASHGMAFDISEDSEVVDLLIGDVFNPNDPFELPEGDGFRFQGQDFRNSGNFVTNNAGDGLLFLRRDAAIVTGVRIIDNLFDGNANGINYIVRNDDNIVNTVTVQHNDITNNAVDGLVLSTQIDAQLLATVDNNLIANNLGDGIFTRGVESDATDAESLGGTFTRNMIQGNLGIGINVNTITGAVAPLTIGMMGFDGQGRSLGNMVTLNGDDGIEVNSPGDVSIINNLITFNGQNNVIGNPHGDGKGIDINLNDFSTGFVTTGGLFATIVSNIIQENRGDGVEVIARSNDNGLTFVRAFVVAYSNIIDLNLGRGVDVLNAGNAESYLIFGDGTEFQQNNIRSNELEGFYAVNTPSTTQRQDVDAAVAMMADVDLANGAQRNRTPNLVLDINNNEIRQNGEPTNPGQLNGSGLVIRVGTSGSNIGSEFTAAEIPDYDGVNVGGFTSFFNGVGSSNSSTVGNGRVNARVNNNTFGGNFGVDVLTESFVATTEPPATGGTWNGTTFDVSNNGYTRDPLARLNLEFMNNTGDSIDLVRQGAAYSTADPNFKSRTGGRTGTDPDGPFGNGGRLRTAQRLVGRGGDFSDPDFGMGGLFDAMMPGSSGTVISVTPGTADTPIIITTDLPHLLDDFDLVLLEPFFNNGPFEGFSLANIFEVTVIDETNFALRNTIGETDIDEFDFFGGMEFFEVTFPNPFLYPGVGPSTFRIIEGGNSFPQGNDFSAAFEQDEFIPSGTGNLSSFTFDREVEGAFNFRTLTTTNATVAEGGMAQFDITISEPLTEDLFIFYHTEFAGSATDSADYTPISDFVVLLAGQTTVSVMIQTVDDGTFEGDETFKFVIDSAQATFQDPSDPFFGDFTEEFAVPINRFAIGTITDADPQPTITISNAGGFEIGNGGVGKMTFTVTLSNASAFPVFVDFATTDGTANVNQDYRFNQGTLTFAPGELVKTITVEILPDDPTLNPGLDFDQETLFVDLSAVQGATLTNTRGVGTIFDTRIVNISDAFVNGDADPGTTTMTFTVTLTDANGNLSFVPVGQQIQVNYSTQNGTALAGSDYVAVPNGVLIFNEFESTKTFTITVTQERIFEGDERFTVNFSSTQGTVIDSSATGNILEPIEVASTRTADGQTLIRAFDIRTNIERFSFNPYPGFFGEAHIALGDFNNDGINDVVTAAGAGAGPHVRVFNGATGVEMFGFFAYDPRFTGGVWVATGDINNDGTDDILVGPDTGGGPHIRVFDGLTLNASGGATVNLIENFFATGLLLDFTGGIRVASANVDGLPGDEIILGYGPGGLPLVQVFTSDGNPDTLPTQIHSFEAYATGFDGGVFVSAADFGGGVGNAPDGIADIVTGTGRGAPHVKVFNGATLAEMESFFAYAPGFIGGVRVATGDVANDTTGNPSRDRISEILTAPGAGGAPHVRAFSIDGTTATPNPPAILNHFAFSTALNGGTFIAGRNRLLPGEGSPLMLDSSVQTSGDVPVLTKAELAPVIEAAFNRLSKAGVSQEAIDQLRQIEFVITDLDGLILGLQTPNRISIDRTAAGRGYFVDLTPDRDEEFENVAGQLVATDAAAKDKVDLLSVLLHELEHALGETHQSALGEDHHLLAPTILPGERRLPEHDSIFADGGLFESLLNLN